MLMTRKICTVVFFFASLLCSAVNINASTLPANEKIVFLENKPPNVVPPPVLKAFTSLLDDISGELGSSIAEITQSKVIWSREKNQYSVAAMFMFGICGEGGFTMVLYATFKANGELVNYRVLDAECTGRIEF